MIVNPTQAMLDNAFKANKRVAKYLIYKCGLDPLYIQDGDFYFSKTCELKSALNRLPFWLKVFGLEF